jgi:hypothetical protein
MEQKDILNGRATTARHPKALYILFFTEMWERFGYYLMVGILFLYLIDPTGKGFDQGLGADVVGSFIALVYFSYSFFSIPLLITAPRGFMNNYLNPYLLISTPPPERFIHV